MLLLTETLAKPTFSNHKSVKKQKYDSISLKEKTTLHLVQT
jgi:hypothetical protein